MTYIAYFYNKKRKGDTFGEFIKQGNLFPQEGDMPNVDAAKVKKDGKEVEEDFSEFEVTE